jgi:pectate lyase
MSRPAGRRPRSAFAAIVYALSLGALACSSRILYIGKPQMDAGEPPDVGVDLGTPDVDIGPCTTTGNTEQVGYSTYTDPPTNGGGNSMTVFPTTQDALQKYADMTVPLVIVIRGTIAVSGQVDFTTSDKTIRGVGSGSGLAGGGMRIKGAGNIVVQNLKISKALGTDAITLDAATYVWIDHCDLSTDLTSPAGTYDDLIDIIHAADFITVSWTWFHDHNRDVSFIGNSDQFTDDTGHLHVTWHHNRFTQVYSHTPSLRFGTVHAYSNYYESVTTTAIVSRMSGQVLADDNYFDTVGTPLTTQSDSPMAGEIAIVNNYFDPNNCGPYNFLPGTQTNQVPLPYSYASTPANQVPPLVMGCAGTGKIGL